ncbi:MAG TPA: hypothetical protein VK559_05655 [Ferruginibacter sp.]|nr:hypothetical protein [Ferruginibacter sp.]
MKKIVSYITPLALLSLACFVFAVILFFIPSEHGTHQYLATILFCIVSVPALIVNAIINWAVSERKKRLPIQLVIAIVFIIISYFIIKQFSF